MKKRSKHRWLEGITFICNRKLIDKWKVTQYLFFHLQLRFHAMTRIGRLDLFCLHLLFVLFLYTSSMMILVNMESHLSGSILLSEDKLQTIIQSEDTKGSVLTDSSQSESKREYSYSNSCYIEEDTFLHLWFLLQLTPLLLQQKYLQIMLNRVWKSYNYCKGWCVVLQIGIHSPSHYKSEIYWIIFNDRDPENALTTVDNNWKYMENFCIFQQNKSIYLINNHKNYPLKKYPCNMCFSFVISCSISLVL